MPSIFDTSAIDELARELRMQPHKLKRLRNFFFKQSQGAERALAELEEVDRERFAAEVQFRTLELVSRHDSQIDGATKLIFRTAAGLLIESVILRLGTGRVALCLSSQVGCAAKCQFCATGKMGIARNLTAAEILDQVVQASELVQREGRRVRNLVFMGMGEPLHNEAELYPALEVLQSPACFNLSLNRVIVSTVGIPDAMVRCVERFPDVRMAVSLHSARPDVRRTLLPITERHSLSELREAMLEVARICNHEVMIEYLVLAGLNDTIEDVDALTEYLVDIPVHINLIPFNPIDDAPDLVGSSVEARQAFSDALKARGFPVTTRYSLGRDIEAACGQLIQKENRRIAMATLR